MDSTFRDKSMNYGRLHVLNKKLTSICVSMACACCYFSKFFFNVSILNFIDF